MADPLRVLHLIERLDPTQGGPPVSAVGLAGALSSAGCDVNMLSMDTSAGAVTRQYSADDGLLVTEHAAVSVLGMAFSARFAVDLFRQAKGVDVIMLHGYYYLWHVVLGGLASILFDKTLVVQPHGVFEAYHERKSRYRKRLYRALFGRFLLRRAAVVLVSSESEIGGVARFARREKIHLVEHGIKPCDVPPHAAMHSPVRLLTLSRITEKKRIDLSIRAVSIVRDLGLQASLIIAGEGSAGLTRKLKDLVIKLDVADLVSFVGHVSGDSKARLLEGSDIFLLPSESENFALAVVEGLSYGLPCVVTAAVGTAKYVSQGAGRVIASPNAEVLARAIMDLCENAVVYAKASVSAQTVIREQLSWAKSADKCLSILLDVREQKVGSHY